MKKRTIIKLKSLFGGKSKLKRQLHQPAAQPRPESGSPSPPPASYRTLAPSPPPPAPAPPRHPPSPPVPTSPVAPTAPEPPPGPRHLLPCSICSRTFLPDSLAKHTKICEKTAAKKRKTFDSSRQRREGTDLAQFLPKNFGLPENSPFLEKSPPPTAKPQQHKKAPSVRTVMSKPAAELSKCPHCGRGFGVRAFERHVEWCADKAKILPAAATAQPPAHVAQARHRLQARTQYKAPLAAGRRSLTRDKSSNSRSASVESRGERALSPPAPPRDSGDHRRARTRASESVSSSEYHEESPHVPVIRQSKRGSAGEGTAGNAARARHARLARDLNSTSNTLEDHTTVRESKTDPSVNKKKLEVKCKNKLPQKKQQQLNKLEDISKKYMVNKVEEDITGKKAELLVQFEKKPENNKNKIRTSQIPMRKVSKSLEKIEITAETNPSIDSSRNIKQESKEVATKAHLSLTKKSLATTMSKSKDIKTLLDPYPNKESTDQMNPSRVKNAPVRSKKATQKKKESTISLDSLDDNNSSVSINLKVINNEEMLCPCVPCVIYENTDQNRLSTRLEKITSPKLLPTVRDEENAFHPEPKEVKTIYENPSLITSSAAQFKTYVANKRTEELNPLIDLVPELDIVDSLEDIRLDEQAENDLDNLATDQISSETYTKQDAFIPTFFDEFMDLTDKLMVDNNTNENDCEEFLFDIHTPDTESIDNLNTDTYLGVSTFNPNEENSKPIRDDTFTDSITELKSQLKEILVSPNNNDDENQNVHAMEHITIYELQTMNADEPHVSSQPEDRKSKNILPSISENNKANSKIPFNKKKCQKSRKSNSNFKMLRDLKKSSKEFKTYIVAPSACDTSSEVQSVCSETSPLKLPQIDTARIDDEYDPFLSAARQMKELMSSDTNIPKKIQSTPKDPSKTLPYLRNHKEKSPPLHLRPDNSKTMKDAMNKNTQRTPILQRMKSFGSSNSDYSSINTFGGRSSSFRVSRNDKKSSPKLNTTFTKSSKENISTLDKFPFNRSSSLNKSFSNYTSNYSTSKSKEKPVSMSSSLYHSFQRTVKPSHKLEKIENPPIKKEFVNLDSILADDNSSTADSNYIDPRLINENDNLPINVNTILNNPEIISSMESLLNTDNLPAKFESFKVQDNKYENNNNDCKDTHIEVENSSIAESKTKSASSSLTPTIDDLSAQYDKIMTSLEQSIASKASVRDDDSLCEDFDLEEFMTSFDEELDKQKSHKRSYSSTTRVVKASDRLNSNETTQFNSISSSPKVISTNGNGLIPFNKSSSMTFSNNNITESVFPSSVKRSASLLDSFQKKSTPQKIDNYQKSKSRGYKVDEVRLEQDIMLSLEEFERFYESEQMENSHSRRMSNDTDTTKRECYTKSERKIKRHEEQFTHANNHHIIPNGKASNDSAYSSLNRISPSKLSVCNPKEGSNMSASVERAGSDSSASHKESELRAHSSDEFLALERSTETLDCHMERQHSKMEKLDLEKRGATGRRTPSSRSWRSERRGELSSSSTESLRAQPPPPPPPRAAPSPAPARLSRFCHECGSRFPDAAKFCIECGAKRLAV